MLDLTGCRPVAPADVRRVILMDGDLILGPGPTAHVRTDAVAGTSGVGAGGGQLVLHVRDGRLRCESRGDPAGLTVEANGRPLDRHVGVPLGAHVRAGGLSFVVTAA